MKLEYADAMKELFKKYNLKYDMSRENIDKYYENLQYLAENDCYIELYGYAWTVGASNINLRYNRRPVFGRFHVSRFHSALFSEYDPKKPGKIKKDVDATIRHYATSYLEAVQGYNELIDQHLEVIKAMEEWANSYRIY